MQLHGKRRHFDWKSRKQNTDVSQITSALSLMAKQVCFGSLWIIIAMTPTKEGELGPRRSALGVMGEVSGHPQQMTKQKTFSLLCRWKCWDSRRRRVSFLPASRTVQAVLSFTVPCDAVRISPGLIHRPACLHGHCPPPLPRQPCPGWDLGLPHGPLNHSPSHCLVEDRCPPGGCV